MIVLDRYKFLKKIFSFGGSHGNRFEKWEKNLNFDSRYTSAIFFKRLKQLRKKILGPSQPMTIQAGSL